MTETPYTALSAPPVEHDLTSATVYSHVESLLGCTIPPRTGVGTAGRFRKTHAHSHNFGDSLIRFLPAYNAHVGEGISGNHGDGGSGTSGIAATTAIGAGKAFFHLTNAWVFVDVKDA
jgi:hypothetical protein